MKNERSGGPVKADPTILACVLFYVITPNYVALSFPCHYWKHFPSSLKAKLKVKELRIFAQVSLQVLQNCTCTLTHLEFALMFLKSHLFVRISLLEN